MCTHTNSCGQKTTRVIKHQPPAGTHLGSHRHVRPSLPWCPCVGIAFRRASSPPHPTVEFPSVKSLALHLSFRCSGPCKGTASQFNMSLSHNVPVKGAWSITSRLGSLQGDYQPVHVQFHTLKIPRRARASLGERNRKRKIQGVLQGRDLQGLF